jgi:hypothetical protein
MTTLTRRFVQLCTLLAAVASMERPAFPTTAQACATCKTGDVCEVTWGGTDGCAITGGSTCRQTGNPCSGGS